MYWKRLLGMVMATTMVLSLSGCGNAAVNGVGNETASDVTTEESSAKESAESTSETADSTIETTGSTGVSIEMEYGVTGVQMEAFQEIVQKFTDESGIGVTITQPGNVYEDAMKTRMASGNLPDVWVTHGWSVIRYSEYMMPLEDQEWYSKIDASLLPSITDEGGHIYILPVTEAVCGVLYNKDVLTSAGVDPTAIRTWDDFTNACQTIKDKTPDITPIEMSCNNSGVNNYMLECMFPTFLTNDDAPNNQKDALINGTFDFNKDGLDSFNYIADWSEKGLFNEDALTADLTTAQKAVSEGRAAFIIYSTECIPAMLNYSPDAKIGVMPTPAASENGMSYYGVGEGNASCFGIWKDTEYPDECKQFLNFLARPENADKIATDVDGGIPCLLDTGITDAYILNAFKESQEQFKDDITYDNFFDRSYQPSGMWGVFDDSMDILLDGNAKDNISAAIENMQTNYSDLHE